jgi:putative oxidoreductase
MDKLIARCVRPFPSMAPGWYAIPLRLIVGYGFLAHGIAKLLRGPQSFIDILGALGVFEPHLSAWATILIEIFGDLAVMAGLFIPLASVPMIAVLLVAIFTVHLPNGFSSIKLLSVTSAGAHFGQPGYETDLLYLAALVTLVLGGSGPLALDRAIFRWWAGRKIVASGA